MISFVIPAYNEERLLGRTISSIHDSTRPTGLAYEVLVVNDASTDRTTDIARSLGAEVIDVQLRHIAAVRNAGARRARGEVLIFVDADTVVTPTAVRMALDAVARGAIGGAARCGFDEPLPLFARVSAFLFFRGVYLLGMATGVFIFATREGFAKVGGFDERYYTAEDCYLAKSLRKAGKFILLPTYVETSGRKMRAYKPWKLIKLFGRLLLRGEKAMQSREGLEYWYDPPRDAADPQPAPQPAPQHAGGAMHKAPAAGPAVELHGGSVR